MCTAYSTHYCMQMSGITFQALNSTHLGLPLYLVIRFSNGFSVYYVFLKPLIRVIYTLTDTAAVEGVGTTLMFKIMTCIINLLCTNAFHLRNIPEAVCIRHLLWSRNNYKQLVCQMKVLCVTRKAPVTKGSCLRT